jgi:citrate lyase beta subunit
MSGNRHEVQSTGRGGRAQAKSGAVTLDGKMVYKPIEDAARRILARAGG